MRDEVFHFLVTLGWTLFLAMVVVMVVVFVAGVLR